VTGVSNHTKDLRPRFIISIRDGAGKLIEPHGTFETFSDSTIPGYKRCPLAEAQKLGVRTNFEGDIVYSPWSTVGVDLRKYIGQKITIGFETWDCGLGGHFGYAYISTKCADLKIRSNNCSPGNPVTLTAPDGFHYLWSTGDSTQSITIDSAKLGDSVEVELTTKAFGTPIKLKSKIFENFRVADFDVDSIACSGTPVQFTDKSEGINVSWKWDFGNGQISDSKNPACVFNHGGTYPVRLTVKNKYGCVDSITKNITVCSGVGVQEDAKQTVVTHAYPNPSTGTFKMQVAAIRTGAVQVFVTNILGKTIYAENNFVKDGVLQKELDISEQPDGIYFLTIKNTEYSSVTRLLKKN
jgi:PKD repeat protein